METRAIVTRDHLPLDSENQPTVSASLDEAYRLLLPLSSLQRTRDRPSSFGPLQLHAARVR